MNINFTTILIGLLVILLAWQTWQVRQYKNQINTELTKQVDSLNIQLRLIKKNIYAIDSGLREAKKKDEKINFQIFGLKKRIKNYEIKTHSDINLLTRDSIKRVLTE